jgi:hypothetical protein
MTKNLQHFANVPHSLQCIKSADYTANRALVPTLTLLHYISEASQEKTQLCEEYILETNAGIEALDYL